MRYAFFPRVRNKIKNPYGQHCSEGFNSGVKGLIYFIVNNDKNFQIKRYIVLIRGINTIFIDQMPTLCVFRKVHSLQNQNIQQFTTWSCKSQE